MQRIVTRSVARAKLGTKNKHKIRVFFGMRINKRFFGKSFSKLVHLN